MKSGNYKSLLMIYLVIMSPGQMKQPALAVDENGFYFYFRRWRPGHNIYTVMPLSLDPGLDNN